MSDTINHKKNKYLHIVGRRVSIISRDNFNIVDKKERFTYC